MKMTKTVFPDGFLWGGATAANQYEGAYKEDTVLISSLGCEFIKGIQGDNFETGVAATAKHYFGYAPCEAGLNMAPSMLSQREIDEVHLRPFQAAITECGLASVMNSYSVVNGEAISNSKHYLSTVLRGELGFDGMVISDYTSIEKLVNTYNICESIEKAGADSLNAGIDIEAPVPNTFRMKNLLQALEDGSLSQESIDKAVERVLTLKFRLGLFENPYPEIESYSEFHNEKAKAAVYKAARESLVLLKNENETLPLKKTIKKIAIIGPAADSLRALYGAYTYPAGIELALENIVTAQPGMKDMRQLVESRKDSPGIKPIKNSKENPQLQKVLRSMYPDAVTLKEELAKFLPDAEILYAKGCEFSGDDVNGFDEALKVAENADVVLLAVGGKNGWGGCCTIGEGIDSKDIGLPGVQNALASQIFKANPNTVVIHMDGRPLASEEIVEKAPAIIEAWQPATYGAKAIMETLFGDYNPAGRLPFTAARYAGQLPVYYNMKNGAGNKGLKDSAIFSEGYIDGTSEPLFWFGHGLSYSTFEYSDMVLSNRNPDASDEMTATVKITNTSNRDGEEVVQLYVTDQVACVVRPVKELVGFKRIGLKAGESKSLQFRWKLSQMAFRDLDMNWKVEKGEMIAEICASAFDVRQQQSFNIMNDLVLTDGKTRGFFADVSVM